MSGKRIILLWL